MTGKVSRLLPLLLLLLFPPVPVPVPPVPAKGALYDVRKCTVGSMHPKTTDSAVQTDLLKLMVLFS